MAAEEKQDGGKGGGENDGPEKEIKMAVIQGHGVRQSMHQSELYCIRNTKPCFCSTWKIGKREEDLGGEGGPPPLESEEGRNMVGNPGLMDQNRSNQDNIWASSTKNDIYLYMVA